MINFHRWSDESHQVVFEGNSFYYCNSMCVAFREKNSKVVYAKGKSRFGKFPNAYMLLFESLSYSADIKYLEKDDFYRAANAVYAKALLRGIRRIGLETLFCQNKPKGEKNVVNVKSNAG